MKWKIVPKKQCRAKHREIVANKKERVRSMEATVWRFNIYLFQYIYFRGERRRANIGRNKDWEFPRTFKNINPQSQKFKSCLTKSNQPEKGRKKIKSPHLETLEWHCKKQQRKNFLKRPGIRQKLGWNPNSAINKRVTSSEQALSPAQLLNCVNTKG